MDATHSHQRDPAQIDQAVARTDVIALAPAVPWRDDDHLAALLHEKIAAEKKLAYHGTGSWVDRAEMALAQRQDALSREQHLDSTASSPCIDKAFQNAELMARVQVDQALRFVDAMLDQPVFRNRTPDHGPASIMRSDAAVCRRIIDDALRAMEPKVQRDRKHPRANDLMDTRRQD